MKSILNKKNAKKIQEITKKNQLNVEKIYV